jgi:hypothetical protein
MLPVMNSKHWNNNNLYVGTLRMSYKITCNNTYCREQKILVVNVIPNLVRLSQIRNISLSDYAHVNKMSKIVVYLTEVCVNWAFFGTRGPF